MKWFKFKFAYFFTAFIVGIVICRIVEPAPEVVVKFPSPYNAGSVLYHGDHGQCYKYDADAVECPVDKDRVKKQPSENNVNNKMK